MTDIFKNYAAAMNRELDRRKAGQSPKWIEAPEPLPGCSAYNRCKSPECPSCAEPTEQYMARSTFNRAIPLWEDGKELWHSNRNTMVDVKMNTYRAPRSDRNSYDKISSGDETGE